MDRLYLVMPAYNEQENIERTIEDWYPVIDFGADNRFIIADSGSNDKTHEILISLKKIYPKLIILSDTEKYHGPKVIALYKYAIENGADFIFQTDSDGQTNPKEFNDFWKFRNNYDGIFGNRTVRGDGHSRALVEKIVCLLLKFYFGVNVPDANAPFRLMKSEIVKKYIYKMNDNYNLPNIMITTYFTYYNENIIFKEISFENRKKGKNSINMKKIFMIGIQSLKDFYNFKKDM